MRMLGVLGLICWLGFWTEGCGSRTVHHGATAQSSRGLTASADLRRIRGGRHLARLHPQVRAKAIALYQQAQAQGIQLKFISGYRKMRRRKGRASWHNFGMAFDLNLAEMPDMKTAVRRYRRDAARWAAIGRIGKAQGLIWGRAWKIEEIFHFEWHPGMPQGLRGRDLRTLLRDAGPLAERPEAAWHHFH